VCGIAVSHTIQRLTAPLAVRVRNMLAMAADCERTRSCRVYSQSGSTTAARTVISCHSRDGC